MPDLAPHQQRVADALARHGLAATIRTLSESAATAEMAAAALGVATARIVKSLIFSGADTGRPVLLLVSGANRVSERRVGRLLGERLARADADLVKSATGFSIGGVSPYGHPAPIATAMDETLLGYDTVWAAAGHPNAVFEIAPADLARTTRARIIDVT